MNETSTAIELTSARLKAAHTVWTEQAAGRLGPKRDEITPARLRRVTAWTFMMDVVGGGTDFRFRFAGDRIIQFMGRSLAGELLSAHLGTSFFDGMNWLFQGCIQRRAPFAIGPMPVRYPGKEHLEFEALVMPVSEDGTNVTALFGALESWQLGTNAS